MSSAVRSLARTLRAWWSVRGRARLGSGVHVAGRVWVHGGGSVRIGDESRVDAEIPVELHAMRGASILIAERVEIGGGTSIEAECAVTIGAGARLGRFCKILDTHFHAVTDRLQTPPPVPVTVGEGAVIGDRAILLPGARVAPGGTVRPGATVRGPALGRPASSHATPGGPERSTSATSLRGATLCLHHPLEALRAALSLLRARVALRRHERGKGVRVYGPLRVVRDGGELHVGARVTFIRGMIPCELAARAGGLLEIGERSVFNYGSSICASKLVHIGRRCMFGSFVRLHDRDGDRSGPIVVEDDVWLAHGVVVAPGVTIGAGSVVSAGSVVLRDVPPGSLAAGNPARAIPLAFAGGQEPERATR